METGIREAKNSLSKLVEAARDGREVFLTSRGRRVAQLIAAAPPPKTTRGRGFLKDRIRLYPGWDSGAEDKKIEDAFEASGDIPFPAGSE
jgi:prevent-host-death family protein